jgi:two-component system response regulator PilR (NtrC family)/two-component system response regulator HydG
MLSRKVLIVEDHQESRESLASALKRSGFDVLEASSLKSALPVLKDDQVGAIISELKLPDGDGLNLLTYVKRNGLNPAVIFVTAFGTMSSAIRALKLGAADFLVKPVTAKDVIDSLTGAMKEREVPGPSVSAFQPQNVVTGVSSSMRELFSLLQRVAPYESNILLYGESGSGKEVIAREIHNLSPRKDQPFVPINCASLSDELLENELFGHERGAFTGANERKIGVFETAHEGTLFLDEINEMGLRSQAKLLRALERKEFRRLGGTKKIRSNLRLVCATNVNLEDEVKARRFREDLYYRIKVVTLTVPPLRERKDDITFMIKAFLEELQRTSGKYIRKVTPEALARLQSYAWPGNVRELKNVVESVALMAEGDILDVDDLPENIRGGRGSKEIKLPFGITMEEAEKEIIRHYLEHFKTKKEAAKALKIGLRTLYLKVKRLSPLINEPANRKA